MHPEDRDLFRQSETNLRRDKAIDISFRILLDSGEVRYIREVAIEVTDENGDGIGAFGILQDVSDRVRYHRDLEYRDELARQAESITEIGHFIYDEENERYVYLSEGLARIFGTSVDVYLEAVKSNIDDLADIVEEDRARVAEEYRHYIESGQDCAVEYRIRRPDGSIRWLRELGTAKQRKNGLVTQTLGVVQDVTERVRREQELVFKDAIAGEAESLTGIGYFLFDEIADQNLYEI